MRLTGSLRVWLAECSILSLCNVLLCRLDDGLAHWAANGLSSMARDGGGYSEEPWLLCFQFVLLFWFVTTKCFQVFPLQSFHNDSNHKPLFTQTLGNTTPIKTLLFTLNNTMTIHYVILDIKLDFHEQRWRACDIAASAHSKHWNNMTTIILHSMWQLICSSSMRSSDLGLVCLISKHFCFQFLFLFVSC